jgi:hypothetical protein
MKNILCFLITTIFLNGCDTPVNENKSYDYSIEQQTGCFCVLGGVWVKLFVKADTIADAINLSDNSRLAYEQQTQYRTIKGLNNELLSIDTSIYDIRVTMDTVLHYPSFIYFNPKPIIHGDTVLIVADAQMSYSTRNYTKLK